MSERKPRLFPTLRYQDPQAAVTWLAEAFGFVAHYVARDNAGRVIHAQMRLGDDLLFLGPDNPQDAYGMHSPRVLNGTNQCVCVGIHEVDAHCDRARAAGAEIVADVHDTPYGAREYSCRDPEGHIWCFGNYWGEPLDRD